jgi:hypothetical protein
MKKHLRLLLLLFLLAWPVHAQTGPGNIQPSSPAIGNAQNAITTNGTGTAINVQNYGAAVFIVTITGTGTPVVTFKSRSLSSGSYTARYGYLKTDSTKTLVSTTSTSGEYYVDCAGDYDAIGPVTGTWTGTVTVTIKGVPATARVGAPSGGGSTSLAVGTTAITGGTSGRVLKDNAGTVGEYPVAGSGANVPLIDGTLVVASGKTATVNDNITLASDGTGTRTLNVGAGGTLGSNAFTSTSYMPLAGGTFTGDVTHSGAAIIISGNISTAAWTTNGVRIKGTPGTLTDTTSSGTVATAYTDVLGGNTIAASSAATFTNYFTQYNKDPIAGTNVTLTNKWALGGDSLKVGTSNPLTVSNAGVLNATSPVFVTPTLGAATATTINGNTFTTSTYTLTGTAAKTLNFTNTLTLSGTDSTTQTFPSTSATIARTDAGQTFTGTQVIGGISFAATNSITGGAGNMTITAGTGNSRTIALQTTTSGGVATTFLTGNADQSATFAAGISIANTKAVSLDGGNSNNLLNNGGYTSLQNLTSGNGISFNQSDGTTFWWRITSSGHLITPTDNLYSIGASGATRPAIIYLATGAIIQGTGDASSTTTGALQVAGGAAIRKRVFIDGITTSSGLQTAVLCQSSGGEMIADSVACLASSGRFKWDIKPLVVGLDEVMRLRPVSYRYKPEGIFAHNLNFQRERVGFIAEDINQVDSRLVGYEADGKTPRTIGYDQITPILVKSIQELKAEVDALKAEIQSLKQPRHIAFHLPSVIGL